MNSRKYVPPVPYEPLAQDPTSSEAESEDPDVHSSEDPDLHEYLTEKYMKVCFDEKPSVPTPPVSPLHETSENMDAPTSRSER